LCARTLCVVIGRPRTVDDTAVFAAMASVARAAGPAGLTFAAIGRVVGVSGPALAQRFGSKREMLVAFAAHGSVELAGVFDRADSSPGPRLRALTRALTRLVAGIETRDALANDLAVFQLDIADPELRLHAVAHARLLRRRVRWLLVAATDSGELIGADASSLARTLCVTYNGALMTWALEGGGSLASLLRRSVDAALAPYLP
jgi:AcrR family transcriptional regulator